MNRSCSLIVLAACGHSSMMTPDGAPDAVPDAPAGPCSLGEPRTCKWQIENWGDPAPEMNARFGRSVAIGDINGDGFGDIVVAAPDSTVAGVAGAGRVHVFLGGKTANRSVPDFTLVSPVPESLGAFGRFLTVGDLNGDGRAEIIVPSYLADVDMQKDAGRVDIYMGAAPFDPSARITLTQPIPEFTGHFGVSLGVGDVNKDGYGDLVVGAHRADDMGVHDAGKAYVFFGAGALDTMADVELRDPTPESYPDGPSAGAGAEFGRDVGVGDLDGDGYAEVLVGTAFAKVGDVHWAGRVRVYRGGSSFDSGVDFTLTEPQPGLYRRFGWQIAVGDVNGDGFGDAVITTPRADPVDGTPYGTDISGTEGRAQVFLGGTTFDPVADFTLQEPMPELLAQFGREKFQIGDLNGDGYGDVVLSATFADVGGVSNAGRGQVFGGAANFDSDADFTIQAPMPETDADLGACIAVGDLNGDHRADIVMSAVSGTFGGVPAAGSILVFTSSE